ncbi:ABC transporter ATP-binding protein [Nocardioides sp. R-C-SC26]|uniref:ABC transporter ATP-binding protein n=1 Tax=Nocardioides sp. R-C-SC26 TaxID=2870414 RepID=UPI001E51E336|nr:ABC transporter ATP-binding protein [Nocardioides sp. R-C-SC26]
MNALVARDLTWSVKERTIVDVEHLELRAGRLTGLLGPNGCGKTSLLHLLAGVRRTGAGSVRLGETDVVRLSARERARVLALVEQQAATALDLTVRQVVELGRVPHRIRVGIPERDVGGADAIARAVEATDIADLLDRTWQHLSGGERQRVHLARALAQEPQVLLLDEPTNHLDLRHQLTLLTQVRDVGITTVAALHDLDLAAAFCDDLVVMCAGRIVASGPTTEVLTSALVAEVYGVAVDVAPHPTRTGMHVRWSGVLA